jgi:parafibromin
MVLKLFNDKVLKPKQPGAGNSIKPNSTTKKPPTNNENNINNNFPTSTNNTMGRSTTAVKHYPIIVVPSALSSIITLMNIKTLLIDGMYIPMDTLTQGFAKRAKEIFLIREIQNNTSNSGNNNSVGNNNQHRPNQRLYKVIDDPSKLSSEEWDKVVTVFASGYA